MKEYIFTFGCGQGRDNCFVAIKSSDYSDARQKMVDSFGIKWAFQYESRKTAGVDEFGLLELTLNGRVK